MLSKHRMRFGKKHLPSCEYTFPPSTGTTESTGQLPLGKSFGSMNRQMMI
jgi:hypothetical protein